MKLGSTEHRLENLPETVDAPFPIFLESEVIRGFGRGGKQLGIPTANLTEQVVNAALNSAPVGIYFGVSRIEKEKKVRPMVMSLGWNPYFRNEKLSGEVHIIHNYQEDFYGEEIKVLILGYIRPERDFVDIDTLVSEIKQDIQFSLKALELPGYNFYSETMDTSQQQTKNEQNTDMSSGLNKKSLTDYFILCMKFLPSDYSNLDSTRMVLGHFCLGGLDVLNTLDTAISQQVQSELIDWIYSQQITSENCQGRIENCGFRGGSFAGKHDTLYKFKFANTANLASTYSALCNLAILGDDFSRVDRDSIIKALSRLQLENGCFLPSPGEYQSDIRFVYIACVISYLLNDWSGVDKKLAVDYIKSCMCYDGGITQSPMQESHGNLSLMGALDEIEDLDKVVEWALNRQDYGYCGRINKNRDTCYGFWIGSIAKILDVMRFVDQENNISFALSCQTSYGGISKEPKSFPVVNIGISSSLLKNGIEETPLSIFSSTSSAEK
ncbi:hypothetical protein BB560_000750 [Smittium megazygosporum]|uniref:riboflavin kinase n=1 Tax=Smittium megazygosporum TaxID=133381 RepID=A0A2T9ZJG8_9FUNG|nr:hypothetical protein BB560_000750 [Smittium megazygosporum]